MAEALIGKNSPLARARAGQTVKLAGQPKRQLSAEEQDTLRLILDEKYDCMHHEWFDLPKRQAEREIFENAPEIPRPDTSWYAPVMDATFEDSRLKAGQKTSILLTAEQERYLFIQFNYYRYRVVELKTKINAKPGKVNAKLAEELLDWHTKAEMLRKQIADTNLALVLAMAKRTRLHESDFADMISEGNMALLRAVDKFDASRGFKFSTYACRAILKAFSRNGVKQTKYRKMFPVDYDPALERSNHSEQIHAEQEKDAVGYLKHILTGNRASLTDIEEQVITHRFGIDKPDDEQKPLTLEQVGKIIGVTKERVRQIQNKALVKMKHTLEDEFLR